MPSYFRKLFGDSNSHNRTPTSAASKSDRRPEVHFVDVHARGVSTAVPLEAHRNYHTRPNVPSPFRPPVDVDMDTTYGRGKSHIANPSASELRPRLLQRGSHNKTPGYIPAPLPSYAAYAADTTPASSRSNSSNSLFTFMNPLGYQYDPIHHATPARPPLPATDSWQSASSLGSSYYQPQPVAYVQPPRHTLLHMHPLLAFTKRHHAPISYDVTFTPSMRTVVDRATQSPIPAHMLAEPATDPPTPASGRIILRSHKFPWTVTVTAATGSGSNPSATPRFTVGPPSKRRSKPLVITNLDVLYAVHSTLLTPITPEEWESLGHGSRAQQKVTKAYKRRCTKLGGGWEGGVRRIDWLGEKTKLVGVEVDKSTGVGKLIFARA